MNIDVEIEKRGGWAVVLDNIKQHNALLSRMSEVKMTPDPALTTREVCRLVDKLEDAWTKHKEASPENFRWECAGLLSINRRELELLLYLVQRAHPEAK